MMGKGWLEACTTLFLSVSPKLSPKHYGEDAAGS